MRSRLSMGSMASNFAWLEPSAASNIGLVISAPLKTSISRKSSVSRESIASRLAEISAAKKARSAASGSSFGSMRKLYFIFGNIRDACRAWEVPKEYRSSRQLLQRNPVGAWAEQADDQRDAAHRRRQ